MSIEASPDELAAVHALLAVRTAERDAALAELEHLKFYLAKLQNARFGKSSEQVGPDELPFGEDIVYGAAPQASEEDGHASTPPTAERKARAANRGALPAHLPRVHDTLHPSDTSCPCCRTPMQVIGEDTSERLDVIPAQFRVLVTHRPKYACRGCDGIIAQAPAPEHLIKSGLPTEAMVAFVLVNKYFLHLPLYRQTQMMALQGLRLDRSTLAFWVAYAAGELAPLYDRLKAHLKSSTKINVDETRAPVLDPGRGRTKSGYFWTMARDDRPWSGPEPPAVVFAYAPGRGAVHAMRVLEGYTGVVQCDGYAAYKTLVAPARGTRRMEGVTLAFCWTHWRRQFVAIERNGPAPIAREAIKRIGQIYAVEKIARGRSAQERRAVRQEQTAPLIAALKDWAQASLRTVSAKSKIAEALQYGLTHWEGLTRFLDDGRIELDTNAVERAIRPITLGRKNHLFAGHDAGADAWACIASLIETAKLHAINPQAYLTDVLEKLVNGWPMADIDSLLPWAWAAPGKTDDAMAA